jgi:hypothetical protein
MARVYRCSGIGYASTLRDVARLFITLFFFAIPALSQSLTVGVEGGVRLTGDTPPYGISHSKRYLVGPMVEVGLPFHFAVEVDALYSRLGNRFFIPLIANESDIGTIANSWEFPVLLKYRLPLSRRVHPFVSAGVEPRYAYGHVNTIHYGYYPSDVTFSSTDWHAHDRALVLGAGAAIQTGHLRIAPEIRYVRWAVPHNPDTNDIASYLPRSRNDEVRILLGIGWSRK